MTLVNNDGDFTFARALVNPDKLVRDQTLLSVQNYVKNTKSMEELEMLKLWKALYYCMWLSDKQEIQAELASSLSQLVDLFPTKFLSLLFLKMFYRTILREWSLLDQYRVNKFYTLIRVLTNKSFELALSNGWNSTFSVELIQILESEVLMKRPNGIRFHIADIFLPELCKVTEGKLDSSVFVGLIQMFVRSLIRADDVTFSERISDAVFHKFITDFAGQNTGNEELEHAQFSNATTLAVQKYIFDTAADEDTPGPARKRLYALHKVFATKSGFAFVDDVSISNSLTMASTKTKKSTLFKEEAKIVEVEATKTEKRKKSKSAEEDLFVEKTEDAVVPKKKSKRDNTDKSSEAATVKIAIEKAVQKVIEPPKSALRKEPKTDPVESGDGEKKKKKKSAQESVDVIANAPIVSEVSAPFIASSKFTGSKSGYVFHKV
jgi:ribosomal RNA-processing protein 1